MPSPIDIESRDLAPHTHNSETLSTNLWRNRGAASAAPGRSLWPETAMLSVAALIKSGQSDVIAKICYLQEVAIPDILMMLQDKQRSPLIPVGRTGPAGRDTG
ncbi:hypothetical protein GEV33_006468 [Tenebrio molitor]|uniref:Uncharacterized protein n=1 Tax=Tenebrio molitor TaxID=7067 RepID=A0A8J6LE81_TENMO|nr:hypothetical protein GEV33_006468 [Tenebrio molitor]